MRDSGAQFFGISLCNNATPDENVKTPSVEIKNITKEPSKTLNSRIKKAASFQQNKKAKTENVDPKKLNMPTMKVSNKVWSKTTKSKCTASVAVDVK